ncbi:hypothetical protein [Ruegeria arenilitoris]|uniref:hypothetical protein n=1 Tax=Ruegeria arenilitoris TaxID=1173585 RepID=UPI0020C26F07|nr:hypothetical protein [Ruegeria arenilitoris]
MSVIYWAGGKIGIIGTNREQLAGWLAFCIVVWKSRPAFTFQPRRQSLLLCRVRNAPLFFKNLKQLSMSGSFRRDASDIKPARRDSRGEIRSRDRFL